nr:EOG090X04UC [Cyclestheria hislopi]
MSKEISKSSEINVSINLATPKQRLKKNRQEYQKSKIEPHIIKAVDDIAQSLPADQDKTKKELLEKLESVSEETETKKLKQAEQQKKSSANLNTILGELKVEKKPEKKVTPKRTVLKEQSSQLLISGKPLGIFQQSSQMDESKSVKLETWNRLFDRELRLTVTHPPANGFQQMILWTQQGKLWHFPINNEQGLDEEAGVEFHEHVFLERHLEPWCPKRGPIRHFMELVCVGLSKKSLFNSGKEERTYQMVSRILPCQAKYIVENIQVTNF